MTSTQVGNDTATEASRVSAAPLRLEVVVIPVADFDRAKSFYQGLGWRVDADVAAGDDYRLMQLTPPASGVHGGGQARCRTARVSTGSPLPWRPRPGGVSNPTHGKDSP